MGEGRRRREGAAGTGAGRPWPLGASFGPEGANLAVFAGGAERVELCLFDPAGRVETARLPLPARTDGTFHGLFPALRPGQAYGLRAHGPWAPGRGLRYNPARLLLDPYARALRGRFRWAGPNLPEDPPGAAPDPRDSAPFVPKGVMLADPAAAAPATPGPGTPWDRTVLYEAHVGGLTRLYPGVPPARRGTYGALAHPALLERLVRLGVTAVELLPVAAFLDERALVGRGLTNHWGYNPFALMAPEPRYALGPDPEAEFRAMVEALHGAGLEVILDVVLNHTAETDAGGPTLSLRGLDNAAYYRLDPADPARYLDHSGCGNTLDLSRPPGLRLATDALRRWAALGVDGFRFDLGATLGRTRDGQGFDPGAPLLQAIAQDPTLGGLKLAAEPWDLGPGGYRLGGFPPPFAEWNDRFRDAARRFWRGDEAVAPELAARLLGSADLFEPGGRRASYASVNFVAAHDGFTALDLATYAGKRNAANGEGNRDGHHENFSDPHGPDGPSADPAVGAARRRHVRNLLATLLLAQGTPLLAMGDEALRTQDGNNNAYCQDHPTAWRRWGPGGDEAGADAEAMAAFVGRLAALRRRHPALRRPSFLHGRGRDARGWPDVLWADPDGRPMAPAGWGDPSNRRLALLLNGRAGDGAEPDAPLVLLLNAGDAPARFLPPPLPGVGAWRPLLDTAPDPVPGAPEGEGAGLPVAAGAAVEVASRSLRLLLGA